MEDDMSGLPPLDGASPYPYSQDIFNAMHNLDDYLGGSEEFIDASPSPPGGNFDQPDFNYDMTREHTPASAPYPPGSDDTSPTRSNSSLSSSQQASDITTSTGLTTSDGPTVKPEWPGTQPFMQDNGGMEYVNAADISLQHSSGPTPVDMSSAASSPFSPTCKVEALSPSTVFGNSLSYRGNGPADLGTSPQGQPSRELSPLISTMMASHNINQPLGSPLSQGFDGAWAMAGFPHLASAQPLPQQPMMVNGIPDYRPLPYNPPGFELTVQPINAKSRVETQIPIKLRLSALPVGVEKLHLPRHYVSKPKLLAKDYTGPKPNILQLHAVLVCTSAIQAPEVRAGVLQRALTAATSRGRDIEPMTKKLEPRDGGEVHICDGCINRERKRAARKKVKKQEDEEAWLKDERRRVLVFNCAEIKEWVRQGDSPAHMVEAPMRIACYCRHHQEKTGFTVVFTITDWQDRLIAQAMSPSIMITDDHKTQPALEQPPNQPADQSQAPTSSVSPAASRNGSVSISMPGPPDPSQPGSGAPARRPLSRSASPFELTQAPPNKRRRGELQRMPNNLTMTPLETAHLPGPPMPTMPLSASTPMNLASFTSASANFASTAEPPLFGSGPMAPEHMSLFSGGPLATPGGGNQIPFAAAPPNRQNAMDHHVHLDNGNLPMYSAPTSRRPSRASSPLRSTESPSPMGHVVVANTHGLDVTRPGAAVETPTINKIIPAEGPMSGSTEVTILGRGFVQGMTIMFGDEEATTTTFWGERSLVCLVPPAPCPGKVRVTIRNQSALQQQQQPVVMFTYVGHDAEQLVRLALTILYNKQTGQYDDATNIAQRIVDSSSSGMNIAPGPGAGGSGTGQFSNLSKEALEDQLLGILDLIDNDTSNNKPKFNLRKRVNGQAALHLASALGLQRFVSGLLARGANPDVRDKGGYTPLHLAALYNHPEVVRRLIAHGADTSTRTLSGLAAAELAPPESQIIHEALRHADQSSQSPSSCDEFDDVTDPDESSQERDVVDAAFELEGGKRSRQSTRRNSIAYSQTPQTSHPMQLGSEDADSVGSPTNSMMALREQVAQLQQWWQQSMAVHLQNFAQFPQLPQLPQFPQLPQLPYLPQMPNMAPLPDYQAAVLQRLAAMVPGIGGVRQPSPAPPSYDEIYPQGKEDSLRDVKQASATLAAAEAMADRECAVRYDMNEDTSDSPVKSPPLTLNTEVEVPAMAPQVAPSLPDEEDEDYPGMLQIGRKNAITLRQQETLRRAHAENLKPVEQDKKLWFIWLPLLIIFVVMLSHGSVPWFWGVAKEFLALLTVAYERVRNVTGNGGLTTGEAIQRIPQAIIGG